MDETTVEPCSSSKCSTGPSQKPPDQPQIRIKIASCGAACVNPITDNDSTLSCETCNNVFHLNCTGFNKEVYGVLAKNKCFNDITWKCQMCKVDSSSVIPYSALLNMIKDLQVRVNHLENANKTEVKLPTQPRKHTPTKMTHQVIVTSDDTKPMTQKTFADRVKSNLRTVPVQNIKVARDGYGIINFPDKSSRDDGLANLKKDFNVQANNRPHRVLLPKITISNIDTGEYTFKDTIKLKKSICEKNPTIAELISKGNTFDVLFIKESAQNNTPSFAVVKVEKEIYEEIKSLNYQLYIDFNRCRVFDRFHLTQCYKCQKFGHTGSHCPNNSEDVVCRYCTANHESKACPLKGQIDTYKCANCHSNHASTYAKCPVLQNQLQVLLTRTQGMENVSKNDVRSNVIVT